VAHLILSHLSSDHLIVTGHILSPIFSSYFTLPHVILNKPLRQEKNKLCLKLREEQVSDLEKMKGKEQPSRKTRKEKMPKKMLFVFVDFP